MGVIPASVAVVDAMLISASTTRLFEKDAQLRTLYACVGVSIVLHALALAAFPGLRSQTDASSSKALTAWFAPRPRPAEIRRETRGAAPAAPAPSRQERETLAAPAPAFTPAAPAPVPEPSKSEPPSAPPIPVDSARVAKPQPVQTEASTRPVATADDAVLRRQYLIDLVSAAKRYMRYPPQARERGWEGRVEIRLVIGTSGTIKSASVKTSSRYQVLDDQALEMIKKGQPRLQIPPELRGREFSVDIPVTFELLTG
jgi:periplasmic protein TonB